MKSEYMGRMEINSAEAFHRKRMLLRGIGVNEKEPEIPGISYVSK